MAAWDRQPQEPPKAYAHFTQYRDLGPGRSLPKLCQISAISVPRLKQLSEKYGWVERCDQWDAHLQAIHDRAVLTEAAKRGKQRGQAFTALLAKSLEALKNVDLENATLPQVAQAMKTAAEGMRLEEGLATQHVTMEMRDARTILSRLPAEVREGLRRILEEPGPEPGADLLAVRFPAADGDGD